jgi:hypothetical protein
MEKREISKKYDGLEIQINQLQENMEYIEKDRN